MSRVVLHDERSSDAKAIAALKLELATVCAEHALLDNICLPGFRFAFAVLKAAFHAERVLHKEKPILFAELYQTCVKYGGALERGHANEHVDGAVFPAGIELVEPDSLLTSRLPLKATAVPTWERLNAGS